ncbi:hypothetical protein [Armatimonas rosea]|uniref:Photolyase/cryptochrome alpha/beta domain-containing protein n=1 Tax=Armatimonas rosea TaxID=685828 RepID=A0A7W9W3H7_ARMRO|nr:hypothetical protein [Armatimonas rosea]MBB6048424.1 hypothetical protein [Armatimonas rosea]
MIVWLHAEHLSEENPALQAHPQAPAAFVFDQPALLQEPLAFTRLFFVYECVAEVFATRSGPTHLRLGAVPDELAALAALYQTRSIVTTFAPGARFAEQVAALEAKGLSVTVLAVPYLVAYDASRVPSRFSAWWREVEKQALESAP